MSVPNKFLKNRKNVKKVVLGKNISYIGKEAFFNAKNLKTLIIKDNKLKALKKNAFKKTHKKILVKVPKKLLRK